MKLQPNPRRQLDRFGKPIGNWIYGAPPIGDNAVSTARRLMANSATLKQAAMMAGVPAADLDLELWRTLGSSYA